MISLVTFMGSFVGRIFFYVFSGLFLLITLILVLMILFLQGKGDMGTTGSWQGSQTIFGGSGGQDIIAKIVWVLGFLFMGTSFGLAKLEVLRKNRSVLGVQISKTIETSNMPSSDDIDFE